MIHILTHREARAYNELLPTVTARQGGEAISLIQYEALMAALLDKYEAQQREDEAAALRRLSREMRRLS